VASIVADLVVPRRKLRVRGVVFILVLHVGTVTAVATINGGNIVAFLCDIVVGLVSGFANNGVGLVMLGER
jgi:hypothetical protein